jgi:hypothetical protein
MKVSFRFDIVALVALSVFAVSGQRAQAQELSADGDAPGTKIVVQDLKRDEGGTVTLRFQMINETDKKFGDRCGFREDGGEGCGPISGVHLLDAANKKKYLVVRDASRKCACAEFRVLEPGGRINLWAKFAAPPVGVQKVTVIVPQFQPVESVPISNR